MNSCVTCRISDGGAPKCNLGILGPRNIEIKGHSWFCLLKAKDTGRPYCRGDCYQREYDIMLIGESPSEESDAFGMPFMGPEGDILFDFMLKAGFSTERTFLTYVARCRTPKKRKASTQEIKTCGDNYLVPELELFKPKVVMTLGNLPLRPFGLHAKGGISTIHGQLFHVPLNKVNDQLPKSTYGGAHYKVVPSLSPASFLHKPDAKFQARCASDYIFAKSIVDGKASTDRYFHKANFKLIETEEDIDWLKNKLNSVDVFAFDTESPKLPWSRNPVMCLSFSWGFSTNPDDPQTAVMPIFQHDPDADEDKKFHLKSYWADLKLEEVNPFYKLANAMEWSAARTMLRKLREPFENPNIAKVAHNIKYDLNVLRCWGGIKIQGFLWDTLLMHHLMNEDGKQDLEFLADVEFAVGDYAKDKRDITGHGKELRNTYDKVPDPIMWQYTATDAECCWRLFELYRAGLHAKPNLLNYYYYHTYPAIKSLARAEWHGNDIKKEKLLKIKDEYTVDLEELLIELKSLTNPNFNPNSNPQIKDALTTEGFAAEISDKNRTSGYCVDKERLASIADRSNIASKITEYRNKTKMLGTYIDNMIDELDYDGRLRFPWKLHGTETGRCSCQLLHQVPRFDRRRAAAGKVNMREIFVVPEGYTYVYMDYSQIELRILAIIANDIELKKVFAEGRNVHSETASTVLGVPIDQVSDFNRQLGKAINFGIAYGSEGYSITKKNQWEDEEGNKYSVTMAMVEDFMNKFRERFYGVASYLEDLPDKVRFDGGVLTSVFGRERHFGGSLNIPNEGMRRHNERSAINCSIQGPAGNVTLDTIVKMDNLLDEYIAAGHLQDDDIFMINTVHDSIAYQVRNDLVDWFLPILKQVAERPIKELEDCCFPVDLGVGDSWASAEMNKVKI